MINYLYVKYESILFCRSAAINEKASSSRYSRIYVGSLIHHSSFISLLVLFWNKIIFCKEIMASFSNTDKCNLQTAIVMQCRFQWAQIYLQSTCANIFNVTFHAATVSDEVTCVVLLSKNIVKFFLGDQEKAWSPLRKNCGLTCLTRLQQYH